MIRGIKTIISRIKDILGNLEYDATTRAFVYIGFSGIILAFAMSAYYFLSGGEAIQNGVIIFISALNLAVFMIIGIATFNMNLAATLSAGWVSFILFPITFFWGGGLNSGSSTWFLMGFAYTTLILAGKLRIIFLILQLIIYSACFLVLFINPNLSMGLSASETAVDSLISVLVVGPAIMIMFYFKELIMRGELNVAKEQKREIERLTKSQQNFFSDMSRKIRTPIGGITGLNEMILRSDNLSRDVLHNTRNISSASDMLLTVLEDIMDMNKMQVGDIRIENLEYDTSVLFTDLINMLEPKAREKGLRLELDIDPEFPLSLFGDKIRMKQILVNIINNGIKYTREGHVKLSAKALNVGGTLIKAVYRIEDTGVGIKPEDMDSLFSDFSRIDVSANRSIEGSGLGLFITRGLINTMGGTIDVESTYGVGSAFTVTLPQSKNGEKTIGDINNIKAKDRGRKKAQYRLKGKKKVPVLITIDSMAGLSHEDITKYGIEILPYCISMPDGSAFLEGQEIDIEAMRAAQNAEGISEEVVNTKMAEDFFKKQLEKAENVIHISLMSADVSRNYERLCAVADDVGHVTIFESKTLSVGGGIMAVHAAKLASEGYQMIHIVNELIELRNRIEYRCRIGEINLLVSQGRISKLFSNVLKGLHMHPLVKTDKSGLKLWGLMSERSSMGDFVDRILKEKIEFEDEIYIAHPDVKNNSREILDIRNRIKKRGSFNNIVFVQSSPIMVANSGINSLAVALVKKYE